MSEHECICIAGGSMFYRHMHESHCPLSVHGEEAPKSKERCEIDSLKQRIERLEAELRNIETANPRTWDDPSDFEGWAKSRARWALRADEPGVTT